MKQARIIQLACTLVAVMLLGEMTGHGLLLAQEKAPAPATTPAGGVPANLLTAEPPFPVVVYTKEKPPLAPKLEDLPLQESVYQYGVTWTLENPARVGRFANGDWYVVGPVTVVAISPKPLYGDEVKNPSAREVQKQKGNYCRNGSVLNHPPTVTSGFDSRVTEARRYNPASSACLPIAMKPGDSLVSSISKGPGDGDYFVRSYSVLTCLRDPVPADAFRPSFCDSDRAIYLSRDLRRDLLPRLALPPAPSAEDVAELRIKTYPPKVQDSVNTFARTWVDTDFFMGAQAEYQGGGYGRWVAEHGARAVLLLCLDLKPEEREPLLVNYTQYAIDLWGPVKHGFSGWVAHGGWGSGRKLPLVFGGIMLGDEKMANVSKTCPKAAFQEDRQTMHDDCWTGAGVVYFGHVGTRAMDPADRTPAAWGPYEHLHPTRWIDWIGEAYRGSMTSNTWVAEALAVRILQAEKQWNYDAFLDYCDRWMTEPDPSYNNEVSFTIQGNAWDPFFKQMWRAYRNNLPAIDGRKVDRPPTGWKKNRPLKGPAVKVGKDRELLVGGKAFFPIMVFANDPNRVDDAAAIGANIIAEGCFEPDVSSHFAATHSNKDFLDSLAAKGMYGVFGADARTIGHPALLGWIHADEADTVAAKAAPLLAKSREATAKSTELYAKWRPLIARSKDANFSQADRSAALTEANSLSAVAEDAKAVSRAAKAAAEGISLSYCIMSRARASGATEQLKDVPDALLQVQPAFEWMRKMDASRPVFLTLGTEFFKIAGEKKELAADYLKCCDVVGCRVPAAQVGEAVKKLRDLAGGKPVYAWIETRGAKPDEVRAALRTAITQGAAAIGYRGFEGIKGEKPDAAVLALW